MIGLTGNEVLEFVGLVYYGVCGLFLFIAVVVVLKWLKKLFTNRNIKKD